MQSLDQKLRMAARGGDAARRKRSLWLAQFGLALPRPVKNYLLGPDMIRAEILLRTDGALHDIRIDRGRIRKITGYTLAVAERDGTVVEIPVAAKCGRANQRQTGSFLGAATENARRDPARL
jgi:hypothetical protein